MIKNLTVTSDNYLVKKPEVHKLIRSLKSALEFKIDSLYINFVNEETILQINREYLKHNFLTDIITFNYSGSNKILDGEIFISVDDARHNAKRYKVSVNKELNRLVIHGVLHLCGYDDTTVRQKKIMKSVENQLTNKNNFALLYAG